MRLIVRTRTYDGANMRSLEDAPYESGGSSI